MKNYKPQIGDIININNIHYLIYQSGDVGYALWAISLENGLDVDINKNCDKFGCISNDPEWYAEEVIYNLYPNADWISVI